MVRGDERRKCQTSLPSITAYQNEKAEGKIRGVSKMIEGGRYRIDTLTQLKVIKSAIGAIESKTLDSHINHYVGKAISSKNGKKLKWSSKKSKIC